MVLTSYDGMSVTLTHLTKSFGNARVVDDLSLEVNAGEFVVLLGPSGCGKTTTLRMIAGLEQATSGEILIDGRRVNELPPQQRDVAMVFQSYALYPHMSVSENIAYPLRVRRLATEQIRVQVRETAKMLEIENLLDRRPRQLSGGERQRVALARAIVRHPKAFLMDEPLSNLDARLRLQMRGELKQLQAALQTTTVYVTHDQAEAMTLGHRVAVLNRGRLQQFDTPMDIYNRPANRFVAQFVGAPGMNLIDGAFDSSGRLFKTEGINIEIDAGAGHPDRPVTLGIRPEHISLATSKKEGFIPAKVYVTELMGSDTYVLIDAGLHRLIARAAADFYAAPGSAVWFKLEVDRTHFFDPGTGERIE